MTVLLRVLIALLCLLALVACSTLHVVANSPSSAIDILDGQDAPFERGDRLVVALKSGEKVALSVTASGPDGIEGIHAGKRVKVATSDIERIEKREKSTAKTVLLVVAIVAAVASLAQYARAVSSLTSAQ